MSKIIVFGAGQIAEIVYHYMSSDSDHEIVAFTIDRDRLNEKEFLGAYRNRARLDSGTPLNPNR